MLIAILGGNVSNAYNIVVSYLMHRWADKWAEEGNYKKIGQFHLGVGFVKLFFMTAIVFLTVLLGTGAITSLINVIPENVLNGLGKAGEMLTAVGFRYKPNILQDKTILSVSILIHCQLPLSKSECYRYHYHRNRSWLCSHVCIR